MEFPEGEDVLRVRAVGYQFNWDVQYPGTDGYLGDVDPELIPAFEAQFGVSPLQMPHSALGCGVTISNV